jgi:hypothetical protein
MAAVQSVPDDEIAAELAASWGPDDTVPAAARGVGAEPAARREPVLVRRPGGRADPADLRRAAERVAPVSLAGQRVLPLAPAFADLLPGGLPRGATVVVGGPPSTAGPDATGVAGVTGATSLALALVAAASAAGSWVAVIGLPAFGLGAAAGLGLAIERLVIVEAPPAERWATVAGSLVGAFDMVILGAPAGAGRVRPAEIRRLAARTRERGSVLLPLGSSVAGRSPMGEADLRIAVGTLGWEGLEAGHGLLRRRRVMVEVTGRRAAARARRGELWLPDDEGRVRPVEPGEIDGLGGSAGDLDSARRQRVRRVARQPVPVPVGEAGARVWPDAG